jgi:DNA-binding response OmpR family regulator
MKKILIVEDDEKLALALGTRLKATGYQVFVAHDALMGVTAASKQGPDLIILDIGMPLGGGFSVAERLQNMIHTAGIPIIFLTAYKQPGLKERARELGALAYFEKPYEPQELMSAVQQALTKPFSESHLPPGDHRPGEYRPLRG